MKVIAIVPARGGSKGIPRKCIRPVGGKPMLSYAITACLDCARIDRVVVSTDDEEIGVLAERFGATVLFRPAELADDETPLDPVIAFAVSQAEERFSESYDFVLTVQPTSPLVQATDISAALDLLVTDSKPDSVISVVEDRHLTWSIAGGEPTPEYRARLNRQQLPPRFRETGAVIACSRSQLHSGSRIGKSVALLELPMSRSVDVDTIADLALCESLISRRRIVFAVVGFPEVGLGHAYRALMIAHEFVQSDITFICENRSSLAAQLIERHHYPVVMCEDGAFYDAIREILPHLVVNDVLDTDKAYVHALKELGCAVVNFEDLGTGGRVADLVINALYGDRTWSSEKQLSGAEWFCLRDEFLYLPDPEFKERVERILVTFGGTDANNLSARVTRLLLPVCRDQDIKIDVVLGPGYRHRADLDAVLAESDTTNVAVFSGTARISDMMFHADLAITSGGRTVYELASLRVPTIVVCQNERELEHSFAREENGVVNLGHHKAVLDSAIGSKVNLLIHDTTLRRALRKMQSRWDFTHGKRRVFEAISALLK